MGEPASSKTLFLLELAKQKGAVFFPCTNTTSRILDVLEQERPKVILLDELEKMGRQFQNQLLNFFERWHIKADQMKRQYDFTIKGAKVFATATEYNHSIPSNPVTLNPIKADEDIANSNLHPPAPAIPPKPELFPDRNLFIKDPETEMQVNIIESDTNVKYISNDQNVNSQNAAFEQEEREFEQPQLQSQSPLSDSKNPSVTIDWDQSWERRFWARAMEEREERRKELELIQRRQQGLDEQKRQIENIRQDLEARENKLRSVEDLIPSSKHLKDIGISFAQALVWVDCIKEVAQKEQIDERTAAWKLADILRSFKELSDLEKAIQQATQQLVMLNVVNDQQKRAINTLVHLQQIGMTEDEIGELVKLIGRWNGTGVGVGQGNGISSMNGKLDDRLIAIGHRLID